MKRFRILTATALIGAMVFGVTACGQPTPTTVTTEPTTTVTETETTPSESETTPSETTTTETTATEFTPEMKQECAGMFYDGLSEVDFGNAVFEVGMAPKYAEGQDVVITFKCSDTLTLQNSFKYALDMNVDLGTAIAMWDMAGGENLEIDITEISKKCTLTSADGVYTLTVPAEYITNNYGFQINIGTDNDKGFGVRFVCA